MKITCIETLQCRTYPNLVWVQIHTDTGPIGLGETFYGPEAVAAYVHETAAPYLLGQDPAAFQQHHSVLGKRMMVAAMGAEARGRSALDIALWDLFGQSVGLPIYRCLGGPVRDRIRAYNTCAGYGYNTHRTARPGGSFSQSWGLGEHQGPYEDLAAWQDEDRAADLARSLLDMGITAMKIWPFDQFADETNGQHISLEQLDQGVRPFRQIREAVGSRMDIAVELHSRWNLPSALRIAAALEDVRPMWIEDPVRMDSPDVLAELAAKTTIPITASETVSGRHAFRALLDRQAMAIVMLDPGWVGGISEAHHIAAMAAAYHRPVAPHDCTGPVAYVAGAHLCLAAPNAMIQEVVRAYAFGWYRELLTELPCLEDGWVSPPHGPGLGTRLVPGFAQRSDVTVRTSRA